MPDISLKSRWNTFRQGLATLTGVRRLGFFIPFSHAASVPAPPPVYAGIEAAMASACPLMQGTLDDIAGSMDALKHACAGPLAGHWNGGYFGPLDTAAAFAIAHGQRPARIIEVGSGSSTHTLCAAIAATGAPCDIRCIDPVPRHEISALGVTWEEAVLSDAHVPLFEALEPGDIAFFDSSHVLFEGTDVDIIQNRILPVLKPGVLVHIHDVFLPDPYPAAWAHRAYTEQIGLGGWLCGGAYRVIFASHYAATRMRDRAQAALSGLPPHGPPGGGSLWLQRV